MNDPVIVVGAGWAGLAAAFALIRQGQKVLVLEAAPQAGGRARTIHIDDLCVDNGQHLLVGAYETCLTLLKWLNLEECDFFYRTPLELLILSLNLSSNLPANLPDNLPGNLPGNLSNNLSINSSEVSFHFKMAKNSFTLFDTLFNTIRNIKNLLTLKNLTWHERYHLIKFLVQLKKKQAFSNTDEDISVYQWLKSQNQSDKIIQVLWEPILLAVLSTPIKEASHQVALSILKKLFCTPKNSDYLFPKKDLSEILPNQIIKAIEKDGSTILYRERVQSLIIENGCCIGVQTATRNFIAPKVVLATPAYVTEKLLCDSLVLQNNNNSNNSKNSKNNSGFNSCFNGDANSSAVFFNPENYQPIATIYFRYSKPIGLKKPMIGLTKSIGHWIFDRSVVGQPNIISVVITGKGPHLEWTTSWTQQTLIDQVLKELKAIAPLVSKTLAEDPILSRLIIEKRAAFSCRVGIEKQRPNNITPWPNVWIAGDYTIPGYPATLESALQSGIEAANLISL